MIRRLAVCTLVVVAMVAPFALALHPAPAHAQGAQQQAAPVRRGLTYEQQQEKINAWTVGVAAGRIEGAPLRPRTAGEHVSERDREEPDDGSRTAHASDAGGPSDV